MFASIGFLLRDSLLVLQGIRLFFVFQGSLLQGSNGVLELTRQPHRAAVSEITQKIILILLWASWA